MLTLWPKFSLIDEITKINVFRLKPLQKITLEARVVGDGGKSVRVTRSLHRYQTWPG